MTERGKGAAYGLAAAALFGASAPLSKLLLPETSPLALAALLYLGAGLALSLVPRPRSAPKEAPLRRADLPMLALITLLGGVCGPILLLVGLSHLSAVAGSLLLDLEAPFTMLLALAFFGEHLGRREALAAGIILLGGAVLAWGPGPVHVDLWGVLAIAGACAAWGLDNNLTQRLSLSDPRELARLKGLGAGCAMLLFALALGWAPRGSVWIWGLLLGAASYGLSLLFDVRALRHLGAAREAAFFATAPFIGALLALPVLHESLHASTVVALGVMGFGVVVLLRARHSHLHVHDALTHEHLHVHDAHHRHAHPPGTPEGEPHSHPHVHVHLVHDHPHAADLHHRHSH